MIRLAQRDYSTHFTQIGSNNRKDLLCVSFIRAAVNPAINLFSNVLLLGSSCDWAVIIYDGDSNAVRTICSHPQVKPFLIHCRRAPDSINNKTVTIPVRPRSTRLKTDKPVIMNVTQKLSIPKTVLYRELLPYILNYKHVFLLDEDISLLGFDLNLFLRIRHCAFSPDPAPLIAQPLIAESNQYFKYVNYRTWQKGSNRDVIASESGLIEQQVTRKIYF